EIALGARRTVSWFHRAEFLALVPWLLPPASDLARGTDLEAIDDHTVALVPHAARDLKPVDGKPARYLRVHLVFGEDGRFVRRELVEMPSDKVHLVESYDGEGNIIVADSAGKELAR